MVNDPQPLAARLRPRSLDDYAGQEHLLGPGTALRRALDAGQLHSMVLWGPPGVGKTSLARLLADLCDARFIALSAVLSGVKDIREAVEEARQWLAQDQRTILFIDEVHRFNKSQQDAFLPFVEDGTVLFVGATTENPSFELNNALLSRARVYQLRPLDAPALSRIAHRAAKATGAELPASALETLLQFADGDARQLLNAIEQAVELNPERIDDDTVLSLFKDQPRRFDKGGDSFYEQISALHKSIRGSSPDAALYWLARMLDGGCDPLYIARRLVRAASEDIGNADPRALRLALDAWETQQRLGSPEGELALAQAVTYLAVAPKSNAVYQAWKAVTRQVKEQGSDPVPLHLRNAPTKLMKQQGHGEGYRYAHDEPGAYAAGESYFPEPLAGARFYSPTDRGLERKISDKLTHLAELDRAAVKRRYGDKP